MKIQSRTQTEQTLRTLVHGYMIFTLVSCCFFFSIIMLPLPGSNAIFYLILGMLLLPETQTLVTSIFAALILLTMLAYPIALIVGYILALVKKWYRLFGILLVINILIIGTVLLAAAIINKVAPPLIMAVDVLINTFYAIYYFRLLRENTQQQTTQAPVEPTDPEQRP